MNSKAAPFSCPNTNTSQQIPLQFSNFVDLTSGLPGVVNRCIEQNVLCYYSQTPFGVQPTYAKSYQYCPQDFNFSNLSENVKADLKKLKVYSIDVECVATGTRHCDRDVAKIAIVDCLCDVVFESYVKPEKEVVSYLTQLTGIKKEDLENAPSLKECMKQIRDILPHDCTLVGQGINHDIYWLGLKLGEDFCNVIDLTYMFCYKQFSINPNESPSLRNYRGITTFSLRQVVLTLMGIDIQNSWHDPRVDAIYSMKLYILFRNCKTEELNILRYIIANQPRVQSFSQQIKTIDGVDLKKTGQCNNCREMNYEILDIWNSLYN